MPAFEREVREAIHDEDAHAERIRDIVLPRLPQQEKPPPLAGLHKVRMDLLAEIHRGLLFNGAVEACYGHVQIHDTLPLTIYQAGVSLVSYRGDQGTWRQRLFRRDLRQHGGDSVERAVALLERRAERARSDHDTLGELVQRALLMYAERAILLHRSSAVWRLGRGHPVPYELLTGGGSLELMVAAISVLRQLVCRHQKFLFVAREPKDHLLLTVAQGLRPYEFAIVHTLDRQLDEWLHQRRFAVDVEGMFDWDGEPLAPPEWIPRLIREVASQVVVGVFRASPVAAPHLFYAHVDQADLAAHIALADSVLQPHRGAPLLLDLADHLGRTVFGEDLNGLTQSAYTAAGQPWRYHG